MRIRIPFVCSFLLLTVPAAGWAPDDAFANNPGLSEPSVPADGQVITLEQAAREAVDWHPSIVEAIGLVNAGEEDVKEAKAGYMPQLRAGLATGYDSSVQEGWRPRANVSASQMIYDFGKVSSAVAIAQAGSKVGRARLLFAVDSLIRDTSYAVIEIQRTWALRAVALDQLASVRAINDLVHQRYQRGAATRSDALQAQARVQAAEATIQEIEAEQRRWHSNLAHLLGRETVHQVGAEVPDWFLKSCERDMPQWSDVPMVMEAQAERDAAMAQLERSKADRKPTVSLSVGASTNIDDPFSRRSDYNFGINVSSSLYSGGATSARARSAAHSLRAANAAEANLRNEISRLLSEAQTQVENLTDVADTLAQREASMAETGKLYRLQYVEMGTRTLVDLLNAEQELHQVRFSLANTRHNVRRLQVDCLFHAGAERDAFGLTGRVIDGMRL